MMATLLRLVFRSLSGNQSCEHWMLLDQLHLEQVLRHPPPTNPAL